ncbi:hypothetical protein ABLG96_03840 [Nakamurella sp. A5-74]|uniref:DUF11 domain-containing protein n=1 Tax=Nakamurella sp. A5-74 TaxID=3158264 RepID=A0AAU8DQN8_9ACTN
MLIAELDFAPHSNNDAILMVIRNAGPTPAHDVRVTFAPPVRESPNHPAAEYVLNMFKAPIATLGPGQRLAPLWHSTRTEGTPDRVTVALTYRGQGRREFTESYVLDVEPLHHELHVTSSASIKGSIAILGRKHDRLVKALESIANNTARPDTDD